jgi:DNA-binding IclR family transcriptional regulator
MSKPKSDYSIQTVSNALHMLEVFYDEDEIGVSELSRRLGLHKNNVFRLLATLQEGGYIEQSRESDRYRLGTRCVELGQAFQRGHTLMRRARPILEELGDQLGETVHLGVLRDFEVVHLAGFLPESQLIVSTLRVGRRLPAHCTALGKVLVGCAEASVREAYDRAASTEEGLVGHTEATIVDAHKLIEHLRSVAVQGYAVDLEECAVGMRCVAAPVHDASGRVIASISASGPSFRLSEIALHADVLQAVSAAAGQLSQELGYIL